MTLDEAIKHAEEIAEEKEKQVANGDWEKGSITEHNCIECASEHRQLAEWLKELKQLREQTRWIPVSSEKLPEYNEDVFITYKDFKGQPTTDVAHFTYEFRVYGAEEDFLDVIAWMPSPEPYKEESEYQRQVEQYQYDTLYEPTFDSETGSM